MPELGGLCFTYFIDELFPLTPAALGTEKRKSNWHNSLATSSLPLEIFAHHSDHLKYGNEKSCNYS